MFIITLIFGVFFYDFIGFNYADEVIALLLVGIYVLKVTRTKHIHIEKAFLWTLLIFVFYLVYSLFIKKNVRQAVFMDFIIQIKPYIGFFCAYALMPAFDENEKKTLRYLSVTLAVVAFIISCFGMGVISQFFGHPSRQATTITALALVYLYASKYTVRNKIIFLTILSIGLLSGRSKLYGLLVVAAIVVFTKPETLFKISFKNILIGAAVIALVIYVAWDKIYLYFIYGATESDEIWARPILYLTSIDIARDFFPLGVGFGAYGSYASAIFYSPIYERYEIDMFWGLSRDMPDFIVDTYYPTILAQFGIVGILLFLLFFVYIFRRAKKRYLQSKKRKKMAMILVIISFFVIESISDSTFTHNRGLFMLMLSSLLLSEMNTHATQADNLDTLLSDAPKKSDGKSAEI